MQPQHPALCFALASAVALWLIGCQGSDDPGSAPPRQTASPSWRGLVDGAASGGAANDCATGQALLQGEVTNARDLGGVELEAGRHVACGALLRGSPLTLDASGCRAFEALGVRSVIDLRVAGERDSVPDAACVGAERVLAPFPVPYGLSAEDYLRDLHATDSLALAFHRFGDASAYPIYFHCTYGRDRTGVIAALLLLVLGATREVVMSEYMLSEPFVGAYPDALSAVLDEVEARGGAEMVLQDAGISDAELKTLRAQATAD